MPPISCENAVLDGNETDIDCGGPDCPPCAEGLQCELDDDCSSAFCDADTAACASVLPLVWLDGFDVTTMYLDPGCEEPMGRATEVWCWADKGASGVNFVAENNAGEFSIEDAGMRMLDDLYVAEQVFPGLVDPLGDVTVFLVQTEVSGRDSFDFNLNDPQTGTEGRYSVHAPWNANRSIMWDVESTANRVMVTDDPVEVGEQHMFAFINSQMQQMRAIRIDGLERAFAEGGISAVAANVAIGRQADVVVHEFRIYAPAPPPPQQTYIEGELACRWHLRHLLPPEHPYFAELGEEADGCPGETE